MILAEKARKGLLMGRSQTYFIVRTKFNLTSVLEKG